MFYYYIFRFWPQRRKTETKPDIYSKDRIFVTSFAFCVITYEPIEVQTFSAPQNHRQNLGFVKDIKVVVEKMTRNRRKVIGKPGDSLLCRLHSIQLSSLGILFSMSGTENTKQHSCARQKVFSLRTKPKRKSIFHSFWRMQQNFKTFSP